MDRLTRTGIEQLHPEQAEFRKLLGKFYHRPPGGESWCDVILRLRSALDTISLHHSGCRVLIVGHQVVVLCMRYLLGGPDRAGDFSDRRKGRRGELCRDGVRIRSEPRAAWRACAAPLQFCGAARGGRRSDYFLARRQGRGQMNDIITANFLRQSPLPTLDSDGDKDQRGRVLVIAGSTSVPGAALLAATAALGPGLGNSRSQPAKASQLTRIVASRGIGDRTARNNGRRYCAVSGASPVRSHGAL